MSPIRKLRPNETVDREAFNRLVDQVNQTPGSSVSVATQQGVGGTSFVPDRTVEAVWGRLTDTEPDTDREWVFQWEQVILDRDGEWIAIRNENNPGGLGSRVNDAGLQNPALEINRGTAKLGDIVRLIPTRPVANILGDFSRGWLFANPTTSGLRPFVLTQDLIPTGGGELDTQIQAEWLDELGTRVILFPAHRAECAPADAFFSLGIGRGPSTYFRGTYGWATFNTRACCEDCEDCDCEGEWQVVTLYAETIAQVVIEGGEDAEDGPIQPGETGKAALLWFDKHNDVETIINSGYQLDLHNDLFVPMQAGHIYKVSFNRNRYVWTPITAPPAQGLTVHHSGSGVATVTEAVLVQVPFDTDVIGDGDVQDVKSHYGFYLAINTEEDGIQNVGELPLIGRVSWQVTCERVMTAGDGNVNSWLEIVLKNNGQEVTGLESRMTSSRRNAAAEPPSLALQGAGAVNSNSGSVVQLLAPGDTFTIWIRKGGLTGGPGDGPNDWITLPGKCHLTFTTEPNVVLEALNP
jgi:hypothetical protein